MENELTLAQNPNTPATKLSEMAFMAPEPVRRLVAQNPNTPATVLAVLASRFPGEVSQNPSLPLLSLEDPGWFERLDESAALALASLPDANDALLLLLLQNKSRKIAPTLARRRKLSLELQRGLALQRRSDATYLLLTHPDCEEEIFLQLAQLEDPLNRVFLARLEETPPAVILWLQNDGNPQVQEALSWRGSPVPPPTARVKLRHTAMTHEGLVRSYNEDAFGVYEGEYRALYLVADGMGGGKTGDIASQAALDTLLRWAQEEGPLHPQDRLHKAYLAAYDTIRERDQYNSGIATTLVTLLIEGSTAHLAYNGDSRAYLWRQGKLTQQTEDHSLLNDFIKAHQLSPKEIEEFPYKNIITRAVGMDKISSIPDLTSLPLQANDILLLCTDGLHGDVKDEEIARCLSEGSDLEQRLRLLAQAANQTGGKDNIAMVLVEVLGGVSNA